MGKSLVSGLWSLLGGLVSILLILCAYGSRLSPEWIPFSTFFSLAFPFFLGLTLLLAIVWGCLLSKHFFVPFFALLISWPVTTIYIPLQWGSAEIDSREDAFSVLTYNVHNFGEAEPHQAGKSNPTLSYILNRNADIVCLQEYSVSLNDKHLTESQIKKAIANIYPYYHFYPVNKSSYRHSGIACFSKFPIRSSRLIEFPESKNNAAICYEIDRKGTPLTLINCHLESNKFTASDKQAYRDLVRNLDTELIGGVGERLIPKLASAAKIRAKHAKVIAEKANQISGDLIICGDFNDVPNSYPYRVLSDGLQDAYVSTGCGPGITYHGNGFLVRIDHLLSRGNLTAVTTDIDPVKFSDHYPLFTVLQEDIQPQSSTK